VRHVVWVHNPQIDATRFWIPWRVEIVTGGAFDEALRRLLRFY
jgi:hypothetical protein